MSCSVISEVRSNRLSYNHVKRELVDSGDFNSHCHDRCELIYVVEGEIVYISEGRAYNLKPSDIVISLPSVIHGIFPRNKTKYERYDVIVNHKLLPERIWERIKDGPDVYHCAQRDNITELFEKLDYYYGKFSEEDYEHIAYNVIEEIFFNLSVINEKESEASTNALVDKALAYIRKNLTTISGVSEVSNALYITKSHLHHLFTKHIQMSPAKYITSKRLLLAQRKIKKGARPTTVFTECGFEDYATFFRNYKRYFGYSPAEEGKAKSKNEILF